MAEAPVVEKVAKHAKKICKVLVNMLVAALLYYMALNLPEENSNLTSCSQSSPRFPSTRLIPQSRHRGKQSKADDPADQLTQQ